MKQKESTHTTYKKKPIIFILLLTTVLVFLLSNKKVYDFMSNQWLTTVVLFKRPDLVPPPKPKSPNTATTQCKTNVETLIPPPESRSSNTSTAQCKPEVQQCSYKYLSAENAKAGRKLLDSITWPETLPLPKPFSLTLTTSREKSSFSIVPRGEGWRVGEELTVNIQLRDYNGNLKKSGGDFLVTKLHNRQMGAGVVGQVQDHANGTFTAVFPLLWEGTADIEVMLEHSSESITVLKRLTKEEPDRIFFVSDFKLGGVTEKSTCNVCLNPHKGPVCNFTDLNTGELWFCYKPKTLDCNTRVSHVVDHSLNQNISGDEKLLFQKGINMKVTIPALGKTTVTILPKAGEAQKKPEAVGYYYSNEWRPLGGATVQKFDNPSDITACLKGKQLHMFGDSTVRQFYEFITKKVPNLLTFDKHSSPQSGPFLAVDHANDIMVKYRCHGPPFRSYKINVSQLRYVANELDGLNGGANTVVVIGVWAHFGTFPMEVYYQRLMTIRRAVGRLLNRAPGTTVIMRTANMKAMQLVESLMNSDWCSLQRDKVLREVFKDSGVVLLEAWEMVQAHYHPHNLHPQPEIIKLMIDVILSNTCPKK